MQGNDKATSRLSRLALLPIVAGLLLLAGCGVAEPTDPPARPKAPPPRVEMMPESSPEATRRHVFDENGREIRTEIQYRDGDKETQTLRSDGTLSTAKVEKKNGDVRSEWQYSPDGKYPVSGYEKRDDGSLLTEVKKDASGNYVTTIFWWNGKPFAVEVRKPDGSFETTLYWRTGVIAGKRFGAAGGALIAEEVNNWSGQKVLRREPAGNGEWDTITFRSDGTRRAKQRFFQQKTQWGSTRNVLKYVDEYDSTGQKIVSRITVDADGWTVTEVSRIQPDGTAKVSIVGSDRKVAREEVRDAAGKVLSSKDFGPAERKTAEVDRSNLSEPYQRSPTDAWQQEEQSPYYRNQTW